MLFFYNLPHFWCNLQKIELFSYTAERIWMSMSPNLNSSSPTAFQSGSTRSSGGVRAVCALVQQLCVTCAAGSVEAYTRWLAAAAERYLRHRTAVSAAPLYTVAAVCVKWRSKKELFDTLGNNIIQYTEKHNSLTSRASKRHYLNVCCTE